MSIEEVKIEREFDTLRRILKRAHIKAGYNNYVIAGVITGLMGSGKTNLALTLAKLHVLDYGGTCVVTSKLHEKVFTLIKKRVEGDKVSIVYDDVSFKVNKEFANNLMRIRHKLNKNVFVLLNCHYSKSITPFLRSFPIRVLTSISEAEIRNYVNEYLFTTSTLWDYLYYYQTYPEKYIILVSVYGKEHIIDITGLTHDKLSVECVKI